ncbi:MAG TPA: HAD-IA family hydrolase [Ktedonobacterales bacterium]|jgi:REG-2-like HAD superfamily hydrolase|nr:HAD-IA family hydrolase [Ktedonobacterales bacterium]
MAERGLAQPQAVRAVFFDAGYTLLAPHPSVIELVRRVCERRGTPIDVACLQQQFDAAEQHLRRATKAQPWTWSDEETINRVWSGYFHELLRPCLRVDEQTLDTCARDLVSDFDAASSYALYPDVLPVLGALQAYGLTLGVISDWGMSLALILQHHDLTRYFAFAVISAQIRRAKPDPELFLTALRRADAIPDYALHIGDSYVLDILGARAAGITPILLDRRGQHDPAHIDCIVVHDLLEMLDLLAIPRPALSQ